MEEKKTSLTNFLQYICQYQNVSTRLLNMLKGAEGFIYDRFTKEYIEDITQIDDKILLQFSNFGKKTLIEFKKLRNEYLQNVHSITFIEFKRQEFKCMLRSDIYQTLKTTTAGTNFIERALLEQFE